jgi:ATP-dependent helicase/nuclease subunit B
LERNLFRSYRTLEPPSPEVAATLDRIHIVAASGVQAEIDEIARRVKRLLTRGTAPQEIVVAFRNTRDVADRVRMAFDDFGVPAAIDAPRTLASAPLVRSLIGVLRLAAEDWRYERLVRVAANRCLRLFDEVEGARTAIELCVRHAQLPSGRGALLGQVTRWTEDDAASLEPTAATAQRAATALRMLADTLDELPTRADLVGWIAALGPLAERLGLRGRAAGDDADNWVILVDALRAAAQVDAWTGRGAGELSLSDFAALLAATAAQAPAATPRDAIGRVRVLPAQQARLTRPKHLFLGNLSEQAFPSGNAARTAALEDGDLGRSDEMLLFYELVTRPTESLTLSYPALDERAQTLPPSPFLAELERAFGDLALPRTVQPRSGAADLASDNDAPLSRSGLRRSAVARALGSKRSLLATLAGSPPPAGDVGASILAGAQAIAERGRRERFGAFEGVFASEPARMRLHERFGPQHLWSPSQLERYAACPFVFFGEHLLALRPAPELALESDVRRRGSVLHETLARLYAELRDRPPDPEAVAAVLAEAFHAKLAEVTQARPGRGLDAALREIERRQIAAWAESFAQQDAEYRAQWGTLDQPPQPAHFEVRFGLGSSRRESDADGALSTDEPFRLAVPIGGAQELIQLTGQIDRIDVGRVGGRTVFNVIDYKTSKSAVVKEEEIHAGRQLQLPLYAMAVEALLLKHDQAVALSAGLWSVRGAGFGKSGRSTTALSINQVRQGAVEPAPGWDQTRAALVERIGQIIAAIRGGAFAVASADPHCTSTCELRTICRIAHIRSLEKQWPPPGPQQPE